MKLKLMAMVALLALSGCLKSMKIENPPVNVTTNSQFSTAHMNVYAPTEFRATYRGDGGRLYGEVAANCEIFGPGYSAKFVTPAAVNLPNYRNRSAAITYQCSYNGATNTQVVSIENKTAKDRQNRIETNGGLIGNIIGMVTAVQVVTNDPANDEWVYPDTKLRIN